MNLEIAAWQRQRSRVVADCRIFTVNESTSLSPITQQAHQFYFLDTADWVNVVPITADNEVVLVRQFRHGSERITLEIPGGMVDPGELPAAAAARECLEETGYVAGELVSLGCLNPNPAIFKNYLHTWLAPVVHSGAAIDNQSTEHTEVQLVPLSQIPELLLSGEIDHALVVATLWRALYHLGGE
ncbi:MAG: NUDIX hydrolase [SAR86 cluster bacterium]|jgi:ADP-ribose pyrophosphatase|tara:strand:- start:11999 stop:12553 length:555 start_codon:yes stop_codon:yes gene_type:complete